MQSAIRDLLANDECFRALATATDDDTATIQAMLDEGGRVHLPSGQYRVTSPLMIDSGTRVEGDGNSTVIMGDFDGPILASRSYWDPDTAKELSFPHLSITFSSSMLLFCLR